MKWIATFAIGSLSAISVFASTPATARDSAVRSAHDAIVRGDWSGAERLLVAEQRIFPGRPEILINLAAVYARTGRGAQAHDLYRRVLAGDDALMDVSADHSASAHMLAANGLRRLSALQAATR